MSSFHPKQCCYDLILYSKLVVSVGAKYGGPTTMEVYGGRHNRRLIGVRIRRFYVEDLPNRLFLRYKVITEDPDRDLIQIPMIHCAFNCRHLMSRIAACADVHWETKTVINLDILGMKSRFLYTFYNDFKVERFIARLDKLVHVNKLSTWTAILSKQREQEIQISAMDQG